MDSGFKQINANDLMKDYADNVIIVVSNGVAYVKELPNYGKTAVTLTNSDGKVMYIEEETKVKTKL